MTQTVEPRPRSVEEAPEQSPEIPPLPELAGCVCFNMRKATRAITQLFDTALAGHELRITQFSILAVLISYGVPRRMSDLARDLVMDRTTLTRNLRPLERAGYLKLMAGADRRERFAAITAEGRALMAAVVPKWRAVQAQATALFGPGRWPDIYRDLTSVAAKALAESPASEGLADRSRAPLKPRPRSAKVPSE